MAEKTSKPDDTGIGSGGVDRTPRPLKQTYVKPDRKAVIYVESVTSEPAATQPEQSIDEFRPDKNLVDTAGFAPSLWSEIESVLERKPGFDSSDADVYFLTDAPLKYDNGKGLQFTIDLPHAGFLTIRELVDSLPINLRQSRYVFRIVNKMLHDSECVSGRRAREVFKSEGLADDADHDAKNEVLRSKLDTGIIVNAQKDSYGRQFIRPALEQQIYDLRTREKFASRLYDKIDSELLELSKKMVKHDTKTLNRDDFFVFLGRLERSLKVQFPVFKMAEFAVDHNTSGAYGVTYDGLPEDKILFLNRDLPADFAYDGKPLAEFYDTVGGTSFDAIAPPDRIFVLEVKKLAHIRADGTIKKGQLVIEPSKSIAAAPPAESAKPAEENADPEKKEDPKVDYELIKQFYAVCDDFGDFIIKHHPSGLSFDDAVKALDSEEDRINQRLNVKGEIWVDEQEGVFVIGHDALPGYSFVVPSSAQIKDFNQVIKVDFSDASGNVRSVNVTLNAMFDRTPYDARLHDIQKLKTAAIFENGSLVAKDSLEMKSFEEKKH